MSTALIPSYSGALKELRANLKDMLPSQSLQVFDNDAEQLRKNLKKGTKVNIGEKAPDFTLSNAVGDPLHLYEKLKSSKIVLVFYRGSWCPYCNIALKHYQSALQDIEKLGATLIAVSAQTPDQSLSLKEKNELDFEVLSDNGQLVAQLYTTVFKNGDAPLEEMEKLGFDFDSFYGNDSKELAVPAIFVIDQDGTVLLAKTEGGDYRNRTEVTDIIESLKKNS